MTNDQDVYCKTLPCEYFLGDLVLLLEMLIHLLHQQMELRKFLLTEALQGGKLLQPDAQNLTQTWVMHQVHLSPVKFFQKAPTKNKLKTKLDPIMSNGVHTQQPKYGTNHLQHPLCLVYFHGHKKSRERKVSTKIGKFRNHLSGT